MKAGGHAGQFSHVLNVRLLLQNLRDTYISLGILSRMSTCIVYTPMLRLKCEIWMEAPPYDSIREYMRASLPRMSAVGLKKHPDYAP